MLRLLPGPALSEGDQAYSLNVKHIINVFCLFCFLFFEDVPLVEFMYLVFTRMSGESYRRRLRSLLLYLCYII